MKKKKVLFVATITKHINAFHLPYLELFKKNNWEVWVITGDNDKVTNYCHKKVKIDLSRSPFKLSNIKGIKQLKKIINSEKFDIIHCHTPMGSVATRIAARKSRKKYDTRVIYTAHGFHFYDGAPKKNWLLFYPIEKWLAKYTDTLITINKEDFNLAKKKFSKRCKDIQYVPGVGIDTKKFDISLSTSEKEDLKKSLCLKKDDFVLTCVARLDKNKNQGFLINVMKDLIKEKPNIHLLLAGRDELNGYYQNIAKEYNLENNVHFLGNRDDIPQLLKITDIVLSASKREGLPVNVMEAFAAGVPVVALKCRGMKDLIENKKNGFIVSDSNNFLSYIKMIYDNNVEFDCSKVIKKIELKSIIKKMKIIYFND